MSRRTLAGGWILLVVGSAWLCFLHLGRPDIRRWDEATNANVVYSTIEAGNWLVPEIEGRPFLEKPPVWYLLTSAAVRLLGYNEVALRLVTATAGFVLILLTAALAARFHSPVAGLAAGFFLLAVRHLWVFKAAELFTTHTVRSADSDVLQMLFMVAAFGAFGVAVRSPSRLGWAVAGGVLAGLALLTKGPLGVTPVVAFAPFAWLTGRAARWRLLAAGIAAFILVAAPWHVAMWWWLGDEFVREYVGRHLVTRFTESLELHGKSWPYYFMLLGNRGLLFSIELVVAALLVACWPPKRLRRYEVGGVLLAFGFVLGVITASVSKLAWYLLPVYPFLALLVGDFVARLVDAPVPWRRWARLLAAAALAVVAIAAARNLATVSRETVGTSQQAFDEAQARCGAGLAYADDRRSPEITFLLHRYRVPARGAEDPRCLLLRPDVPVPPDIESRYRQEARHGGFVRFVRVD